MVLGLGSIILSGLGGGGDVGGSVPLVLRLRELGALPIISSFINCSVDSIVDGEHISGAFVKIYPHSYSGGRFFEPYVAALGFETYVICVKERKMAVVEGARWLIEAKEPVSWIAVDLGGDSLVKGSEPLLGSYTTDILATAALAEASRLSDIRAYLAVGALGLEGGGMELDPGYLALRISELWKNGHYHGYYYPPSHVRMEAITLISYLLKKVGSGMLTIFNEALKGFGGRRRLDSAWLHQEVDIRRWHANLYFFNVLGVCATSQLCKKAQRE